jgi:hypothetical protein
MSKTLIELFINATPVIFAAIFHMFVVKKNWLLTLTYPLDHYKLYKSKRIFGQNKTYRGLFIMILASVFFSYIYFLLVRNFPKLQEYNLLNISDYSFIFYGFIFGFGYIIGELPNSFYKRQLSVNEGKSSSLIMHLIDQIDSVFSIMLFLVAFSSFTWKHFLIGVFFYGFIHLIINYILYLLGLRKEAF